MAEIRDVFSMFDKDDSGDIDAVELKDAMLQLDPDMTDDDIVELMEELDVDGNGTVEFEEFLQMMTRKEEKKAVDTTIPPWAGRSACATTQGFDMPMKHHCGFQRGKFIGILDDRKCVYITGNLLRIVNTIDEWEVSWLGAGHGINTAAISPRSSIIAYAEKQSNPKVYIADIEASELEPKTLDNLAELEVVSLSFSWDAKQLAVLSGIPDHIITLWDWRNEQCTKRIEASHPFEYISFSPASSEDICTSGNGRIKFWRWEGIQDMVLISSEGKLEAADNPDDDIDLDFDVHAWTTSNHVFCGTKGGHLLRFDPSTGKLAKGSRVVRGPSRIRRLLFELSHIITCCEDGHIRWYARANHQLNADMDISDEPIADAAFTMDYGKLLVETTQGSQYAITFPGQVQDNGDSWLAKKIADDHHKLITAIDSFASGEPWVVTAGEDCTVRVWDYRRKGRVGGLSCESPLTSAACHPSKPFVAVCSDMGMLRLVRCNNAGCEIAYRQKLFKVAATSVKFNSNGDYLACCSADGQVFFVDGQADSGLQLLAYTQIAGNHRVIASGWVNTDLYVALSNKTIMYLSAPALSMKNEEIAPPETPWVQLDAPITNLAAGGGKIYVLTVESKFFVYDTYGQLQGQYSDHSKQPDALCVSPDGKLVVTGGQDGYLVVHSTDFQRKQHLTAHDHVTGGCSCVTFTLNSDQLVSAGKNDGMLSVFALNNTNHMTRSRESELAFVDDSEIDAEDESTILEDVAAKFREAEEALHAEERANLRSKVAGLKAKLDNLIQSNETAPDLEKMDRKELVIDFETRDELMAENEARVQEVRNETRYKNLGYDLIASRIKKECWDSVDEQGKLIVPFKSGYSVCSFPVRKRSRYEKQRLTQIRSLRCVEKAEMRTRKKASFTQASEAEAQGANTAENAEGEDHADGAGAAEDYFDEAKIGTESNADLLYDWFDTYTPQRKLSQIVLLGAVIVDVQHTFNKQCERALGDKEECIRMIKNTNERIKQIMYELQMDETIYEPQLADTEVPANVLECTPEEITVEKFKTQAELEAEERARKEEEERLKNQEDNIFERALEDMMGGTLETKKDEINLREEMEREPWMYLPEEELNDDQKKLLKEWLIKKQKFDEERDKYRRALEAELKKAHQDIGDACIAFDEKLAVVYQQMLKVHRQIYEYELRQISLAHSLHRERERVTKEKRLQTEYDAAVEEHEQCSCERNEFQVGLEKQIEEYNALGAEERGMEKAFKKEVSELVEPEQVAAIMALYKKRNRPVRRASVVALRNASLKVMQQFKPTNVGRGRRRRQSLADVLESPKQQAAEEEEDDMPSLEAGAQDPYENVLDMLIKKKKRPPMTLQEHRLALHEYPEAMDDIVIEKLDRSRDMKIQAELDLARMSDMIKDMNQRFDKIVKRDDEVRTTKERLRAELDAVQDERYQNAFNIDILFSLKQGQVEVEQAAVVTDYADSVMIHRSVVDEVNTKIRELWTDKLGVMAEIKGARGELAKSNWEQKRLEMTFEDLTEKTREFQLQRVTKSLQELIKSGQGVDARKEAEISTLERKVEFYNSSFEAKVQERRSKLAKLRRMTKDMARENIQLEEDIRELEISVSERKKIYDLKFEHEDGGSKERIQFNEVVARKRLVDIAKAQAEEIEFLREELTRLRQRTFPSFSHITNNTRG